MHVHEGNEGGGDKKFVGDRIKENAERGDLQTTAREVAVGPVGGGGKQQNGYAENFKGHGNAPEFDIRAAREKNDNQKGNKENTQQRKCVRKIHQSLAAKTRRFSINYEPRFTIDLV